MSLSSSNLGSSSLEDGSSHIEELGHKRRCRDEQEDIHQSRRVAIRPTFTAAIAASGQAKKT